MYLFPPPSDGADLIDELPEKLQKNQNEASLISSPASKNVFIDRSYWEMVGTASVNMEWNTEVLNNRLETKSLYKSGVVRDSKKLLTSQLGSNINKNYTAIGRPSRVGNKEQLASGGAKVP